MRIRRVLCWSRNVNGPSLGWNATGDATVARSGQSRRAAPLIAPDGSVAGWRRVGTAQIACSRVGTDVGNANLTVSAPDAAAYLARLAVDCTRPIQISGLTDTTATGTGTGTVTVTRAFTVDPAAAACTAAAQVGTAAVAAGTAGARTLSAGVASGTTVDVTVTCTHPGRSDTAAAVELTARAADACEDFIGVLPVGLTARAGTIAADAGCVSAQRRENLNGRVYYARRHTFTLDAAATVTATHASAASAPRLDDPYLLLLAGHGTSGEVIDTDDDSGPGRAAQITAILDPGSYTLEATAFGTRRTGGYTLAVNSAAVAGCTTALGALTAGQTTRSGGIERDSDCPSQQRIRSSRTPNYAHWHTFALTQPAWIGIDLARPTGSGLDPYVILSRGHTRTGTVIGQDDDTGPGLDARLRDIHLPPGHYTIEATSHSANDTGTYTLTIPIHGLPDTINATVDQQTTINFNYWPTNATITAQSADLAFATAGSAGSFTMMLAPDRARSHTVSVRMSIPSSTSTTRGTTRTGKSTARSTRRSAVPRTYAATVTIYCGRSKVLSPINGVLCVAPSSEDRPLNLNAQPDKVNKPLYQGPYYVTMGALIGTLDAARAAIDARRGQSCSPGRPMGVLELTAMMLAIGYWENPHNWRDVRRWNSKKRQYEIRPFENQRFPARSLMTLSRTDHLWTSLGPGESNAYLYSLGNLSPPARAFWHPGVGMWQLDKLGNAADLNHGQRADARFGGVTIATELHKASCEKSASGFEAWLEGKWSGCEPSEDPGNTTSQCLTSKENLYMANWSDSIREDLYVRVAPENRSHTSLTGGASLYRCRWSTRDGFERVDGGHSDLDGKCYFYDVEHPEGFVENGSPNGDTVQRFDDMGNDISRSPYAEPFVSFTDDGIRFAVFPSSLLDGYSETLLKAVPVGDPVRKYSDMSWHQRKFNAKELQLWLCEPGALWIPPICAWVSVNAGDTTPGGSFASRIARVSR